MKSIASMNIAALLGYVSGFGSRTVPEKTALPQQPTKSGRTRRQVTSGKKYKVRGKQYPFSSTKQHDKAASRYYMAEVNGFEIMQTMSTKTLKSLVRA